MALPDSTKIVIGTPIILGNAAAHNGSVAANNNLGNVTDEIDVKDLAVGAARQSAKFDFGANFDVEYNFGAVIEWEASPEVAAGDSLQFYLAYSNSATPAVANPAAVAGVDSAYSGYAAGSLLASLKQLADIGVMNMDNVITTDQTQIDTNIWTFTPRMRYATFVTFSPSTNTAALHSDMVEMSFIFQPLTYQVQD